MKKLVVFGLCLLTASFAFAQQPQKQKKTFTARVKGGPQPTPTPPALRKENTDGVLPRMSRGGNPFQMLNPKAPAQYGKSEDSVALDADTGKWKGIKLFTINF
jgi:hypothetical protein